MPFVLPSEGKKLHTDKIIFLQSNDDIPTWFIFFKQAITVLSPANTPASNYINTQTDTYTKSGSYTRTTATNDTKSVGADQTYISDNDDVEYKILLVLKNPFLFQEVRKYDTNQ